MTSAEREAVARILNDPELTRAMELFYEPVDFDALERDGILKKRGHWWQLLDMARLPQAASMKIHSMKWNEKKKETLVQFENPRRLKSRK